MHRTYLKQHCETCVSLCTQVPAIPLQNNRSHRQAQPPTPGTPLPIGDRDAPHVTQPSLQLEPTTCSLENLRAPHITSFIVVTEMLPSLIMIRSISEALPGIAMLFNCCGCVKKAMHILVMYRCLS